MAAPRRRRAEQDEASSDTVRRPATFGPQRSPLGPGVSNRAVGRAVDPAAGAPLPASMVLRAGGVLGSVLARARVARGTPTGSGRPLAVTEGSQIIVATDVDLPSPSGQHILAHEAAHVLQQTGAAGGPVAAPGSTALERRADAFAAAVMSDRSPAPPGHASEVGPQHIAGLFGAVEDDIDVDVQHPGMLTDAERLSGIGQILDLPTLYGSSLGVSRGMYVTTKITLLTGLWHAFGDRIIDVARANGTLWSRSIDVGAQLWDLPAFDEARAAFKADVKAVALRYMDGNLATVREELAALGLRGDVGAHGFAADEPERRMAELREQAGLVRQILQRREELKTIVVGYQPGLLGFGVEATFVPGAPPMYPPTGREDPPLPAYTDVMQRWQEATAYLDQATAVSPALHGMAHQEPERLDTLVAGDEPAARDAVHQTLLTLAEKIDDTREMVRTDDLDHRDLAPLHAQLFFGQVRTGGPYDWTDPWTRGIARDVLMDHQWNEFWLQIGLATLGAAAFMFAPLGGAIGAVAFGVGTGTGILQAGMSWENYVDLATAEEAQTSAASGIIAPGSADAAMAGAILDTLFAFLDVVPPVWRGATGLRAGSRLRAAGRAAAIGDDLAQLGMLAGEAEVTTVLLRGINEFGVAGAARRAGHTPAELLGMVDPRSQVAGFLQEHLERSRAGVAGSTALSDMSEEAAATALATGGKFKPTYVLAAITEEGIPATIRRAGGWKKLTAGLDDDMFVAQRLREWRDGVFADLQEALGGRDAIIRTGRAKSIANDLDMSLTGPNANADRLRAREFLAGRLGASADEIPVMLHGDLFVDPRRSHLYDMIEDRELRRQIAGEVAEAERELMWGYALHRATGDPELEAAVRSQMEAAGVAPGAYRAIGPNELKARAHRADALHAQFLRQQAAGDTAGMAETARHAALNQTMINIAEREGYFSGAAVRRRVTEDAKITAKGSVAATGTELFNAMIDQSIKLNDALADLAVATTAEEVANALRSLGKYGSRLSEAAALVDPRLVRVNLSGDAVWEGLIEDWASIQAAIEQRRVIFSPDYHGIPSTQAWSTDLPIAVEGLVHKVRWALEDTRRLHLDLIGELRARGVFAASAEAQRLLSQVRDGYGLFNRVAIALEKLLEYVIGQQASDVDVHRFE